MPPGLTHALDGDLRRVDLGHLREFVDRDVEKLDRLRIPERIADVAAMQRVLVGKSEEEVGRDADEAFACEALGEIERVLHQSVALMHEHDGRKLAAAGRNSDHRRHAAGAANIFGNDVGHSSLRVYNCSNSRGNPSRAGRHSSMLVHGEPDANAIDDSRHGTVIANKRRR